MIKRIKADFSFVDNRGELTQLVHGGYQQVNVLFTRKGVERGGHYHKQSTECFFVVNGSVTVSCSYKGKTKLETFCKDDFFQITPFVIHSMYFPEDCILVAMYDKCVELEDGSRDIYTE